MTSIDIVITWVDGNDPIWQKKQAKYKGIQQSAESADPARYRDWGTLKYLLRSIEKNANWVRKIFLVTDDQKPDWFVENEKLVIVDHKDFIPEEYLPIFSSHPIENNLHRIPDLSEKFILCNDDCLFLNPTKPEDFFLNGKPRDFASLHIHAVKKSLMIYQIANNDISIINEHFEMKEVLQKERNKWFNLKYGLKKNLKTLLLSQTPRFPGIEQSHLQQPYLKSTFVEVWEKEFDVLDATCKHRFRHKDDVNQWLFKNWQIASGNFVPVSTKHRGVLIDFEKNDEIIELEKCEKILREGKELLLCINDGDNIEHLDIIIPRVQKALENRFSDKAVWEV
ncbi:Stealth CR1 domain-containing protein [Streptococcus danieliae]|uniref:Stealth CR1 domain-containing protein n=1 Tax=Streptococcus danieliae TaxID=747656 RepID=A0A7Z0LCY1_9STRE|nr:Stealth CR1 domain-containing protein [Streptococcus danieliae]MBF0717252.1 Stealth CR1 domain-containing protein [Streptococcus danieliae]NYS49182.1 Stealth CR1 domain-containing protein [Streptococcus danieliae]